MFGLLECQLEIASPNLLFDILILNSGHLLKIYLYQRFPEMGGRSADRRGLGHEVGRSVLWSKVLTAYFII